MTGDQFLNSFGLFTFRHRGQFLIKYLSRQTGSKCSDIPMDMVINDLTVHSNINNNHTSTIFNPKQRFHFSGQRLKTDMTKEDT